MYVNIEQSLLLDASSSNKFSFSLVWDKINDEWSTDRVWGENKTEIEKGDLPQWVVGLDNAATLVMTANTVILMLGMGAATYWKEVTGCPNKPFRSRGHTQEWCNFSSVCLSIFFSVCVCVLKYYTMV